MNRTAAGALVADLSGTDNAQARKIAEIVQRVRPDVLLLNEFDYDAAGDAARLFHDNYLARRQGLQVPISYPCRYMRPSNTGIPTGFDLNRDGISTGPDDAQGYGDFPGQYGFVVYSKWPTGFRDIRTFQRFLWKDMPGALLPVDPVDGSSWYTEAELAILRLSSKNHVDLPIHFDDGRVVHFLCAHPTPPVFDGAEDRNGRRNHDEIRFWADYIDPERSGYIHDDIGATGGLPAGSSFVIAGDMNADPFDGDSVSNAAVQLTSHALIDARFIPASEGAAAAGAGSGQLGDPANDTAAFNGNLRVDYVLPSRTLRVLGGGVFWPKPGEGGYELIAASDHRMVWIDVTFADEHGMLLTVR